MLNKREQRALSFIEQELDNDERLSALLKKGSRRLGRAKRSRMTALIAFGVFVMVIAVPLNLGETFLQGLLITCAGLGWWSWRANHQQPTRVTRGPRAGAAPPGE